MTTTALAPQQLTALDRCDRCGAQAFVRAVLTSGDLLFCAHHGRAYAQVLAEKALTVEDDASFDLAEIEKILKTIQRAKDTKMGVLVHCMAGKGRTGTVLGLYLASQGMTGEAAIAKVRELRPGSIETHEQQQLIRDYAKKQS